MRNHNTLNLPTPADNIIPDFLNRIRHIQPGFIEGVYLTGSIPQNDFYAGKSDIDFLVLCRELPDNQIAAQLKQVHQDIAKQFPKPDLSGCYLASESIQSGNPENIKVLSWHEGSLRYGIFDMAPVSFTELKTNAIAVFGAKAEALPVDIEPAVLNKFLYDNINSYWSAWIKQHSSFFNRKLLLLLFPRFTEWAVLGVARQLCTLQTGRIVSKTEAGYYCLGQLPERFHPVIREAIRIRKDNRTFPLVRSYALRPSFRRLAQTIDCVNYIIGCFNRLYREKA